MQYTEKCENQPKPKFLLFSVTLHKHVLNFWSCTKITRQEIWMYYTIHNSHTVNSSTAQQAHSLPI